MRFQVAKSDAPDIYGYEFDKKKKFFDHKKGLYKNTFCSRIAKDLPLYLQAY